MHPLPRTATPDELSFIAGLDHGQDRERHQTELHELIFEREGRFKGCEVWFPLEVVKLGADSVTPGHEREFVICCLLVLSAIKTGHCFSHDVENKYSAIEPLLYQLPDEMAGLLVDAYAADH